MKMILLPKSSNAKTGNVIQSYSSRSTCPERCPFKDGKGCYAEGLRTSRIWDRCENPKDARFISNEKELKDNGLCGVQCPAQLGQLTKLGQITEAITCEKCGLCSLHREAIVIFEVHGCAHKRAKKVIMLKQQNSGK